MEQEKINLAETEFALHLEENGIAAKTIESYTGNVRLFNQYLTQQGVREVTALQRFYIVNYKQWLMERGCEVATINKKINSLQAYNFFLIEKGWTREKVVFLGKDRVKVAEGSQKDVNMLTDEQLNRLLFCLQDRATITQRNELIVLLLLYTGVRVSEHHCLLFLPPLEPCWAFLQLDGSYIKGDIHQKMPAPIQNRKEEADISRRTHLKDEGW